MKRALLIGSQTDGLTGVLPDVALLGDTLTGLGFDVVRAVNRDASADGIREHYDALIAATGPDDAAVVYYSGHGGRDALPRTPDGPRWLHYIVPTDIHRPDGEGFLLAEELSACQRRLAQRSTNVTTILDCCFSARMSRSAVAVPRSRSGSVSLEAATRRRQEAREVEPLHGGLDSHPDVVRLVACAVDQSAYEIPDAEYGTHGALTVGLVRVLRGADPSSLTWRDALGLIRPPIRDLVAVQRPEVEGPADRLLFDQRTRDGVGLLPVRTRGTTAVVEHADILGVGPGDRYELLAPGGMAVGETVVLRVAGGTAFLDADPATLPDGAVVRPLAVSLGRRRVGLRVEDGPVRDTLLETVGRSTRLVLADGPPTPFAEVVAGGQVQVVDAVGMPLYARPCSTAAADLTATVASLDRLARAEHLRDLGASPHGDLLDDVYVRLVRASDDGSVRVLASGAPVHVGDHLLVRLHNTGPRTRYVAVFDLGIGGAITPLSTAEVDGLTLAPGEQYELGSDWTDGPGIELVWDDDVDPSSPRLETFLVIVAEEPVEGLRALAQPGARRRGTRSELDRLLDDVAAGRRDVAVPAPRTSEHLVHRLDLLLHHTPREAQ